MPTSFEFIIFSDLPAMHDAKVKTQIRKHAMKDIGASRRRPCRHPAKVALEFRQPSPCKPQHFQDQAHVPDDRALYNPYVRALSCQMDPFESASVPIDNVAHGLLQYFLHYSTQFPSNFTFTPNIAQVFDSAIRDELMMNCILSAAASRIHYMQGVSPLHLRKRALSCTQQSLHLIQGRLLQEELDVAPSVEPLIDCILYLAAAALYRGDDSSARIHVSAAVRLVELGGGILSIQDPRVLIRMLSLDDVLACMSLQPCSFACVYDPGPVSPPKYRDGPVDPDPTWTESSTFGHMLAGEATLPGYLRALIPQIVEIDRSRDDRSRTDHANLVGHHQKLRTLAVRNMLLAVRASDVKTSVLRAVLIIWSLLPPNDPRQAKTAHLVAQHLKFKLGQNFISDWSGSEDTGLWCLVIGAFGALIGGEGYFWFVEQIHSVLQLVGGVIGLRMGSDLLESMIEFQKRFLYREIALRPLTAQLVELLGSHHRANGTCVV